MKLIVPQIEVIQSVTSYLMVPCDNTKLGKAAMFQVMICLLVSVFVQRSSASNLKVYSFESGNDSQLVIPVDSSSTLDLGFTVCFRMKFKNWNDSHIFETEKQLDLVLYHYNYDVCGTLTFNQVAKHFRGTQDIKKFNTWQPFCLTYDARNSSLRLYRDGIRLFKTSSFGGSLNFGKWFKFGASQTYPLAASLTDFNIWSRWLYLFCSLHAFNYCLVSYWPQHSWCYLVFLDLLLLLTFYLE